jgi:hypothetical protein
VPTLRHTQLEPPLVEAAPVHHLVQRCLVTLLRTNVHMYEKQRGVQCDDDEGFTRFSQMSATSEARTPRSVGPTSSKTVAHIESV